MASLSEGWAKLNSPVNIRRFNRKSVPGSPGPGLLESGVFVKVPKLDHLELENSKKKKSHFESRKEVCMTII